MKPNSALLALSLAKGTLANSIPVTMPLYLLSDAEAQAKNSICNGGFAAGYYYRKGANPSRWIIHLQGGGWCYDEAFCQARMGASPYLVASTALSPTYTVPGVLLQDAQANPEFHSASCLYLPSGGGHGHCRRGGIRGCHQGPP